VCANGFATAVVHDGISALDYAAADRFDLLILDIGLPCMDRFTVLRRLREAHNGVPVIILTARTSVTDTVAGLDGGADDYVSKPFRFGAARPDPAAASGTTACPRPRFSGTATSPWTCGLDAHPPRDARRTHRPRVPAGRDAPP